MSFARLLFPVIALVAAPFAALAEEDHPPFPTSVERFHGILSKDWHAPEGPNKLRNACSHSGAYIIASQDVAKDKTPADADAAKWSKAAAKLSAASIDFGTHCGSGNEAKIAKGLTTLHDRFHDLVELIKQG